MKAFRKLMNESPLLNIRKRLGLTQQQMSDQIKLSRSMVMMIERGKRSLSTPVLLQLAELELKLASESMMEAHTALHPAESNAAIKCRKTGELLFAKESCCTLKARKLGDKLQTMSTLYKKTREWLHLIEHYIKENEAHPTITAWWEKKQLAAICTLDSCNMPSQLLLRHRISLLEGEAALYKNKQQQLMEDLPQFFEGGVKVENIEGAGNAEPDRFINLTNKPFS